MRPLVYVAGPLGFFEAGQYYYEEVLLPHLARARFIVLDPWQSAGERIKDLGATDRDAAEALAPVNYLIGQDNTEMIKQANYLLAVLDGGDVDSGTAAEIGYAAALSRPVVGIRSDIRMSGDNSAAPFNLQVAYFISLSGGVVVPTLDDAIAKLQEWSGDDSGSEAN